MSAARRPRVLLAKTSLDGHWRGLFTVSAALREAGVEVVMIGAATADQIAEAAVQEDVDVVGLNIGGRVEVAERVIDRLREHSSDVPVIAGGTIAPWARKRLELKGVSVFPPGSSMGDIVDAVVSLAVI